MSVTPTSAAEHRFRVNRILNDKRFNERERWQAIWNYVLTQEIVNGTQFLAATDGGLYAVLGGTNEVIPLPRAGRGGDRWHGYFHAKYGISEREKPAKFLYDVLRHYVTMQGTKVDLRRFATFKADTITAYLSAYNGQMFKIESETEISTIPNGEDGVFFADDDRGEPCEPDIGQHGILIDRLTDLNFASSGLSGITPEQQKMALIIWLFALALPDLMPTKPILLVEGVKGSGKTTSVTLAQLVLMGAERPLLLERNREDDFLVILLRAPIALFDNVDSYIDWVPDKIAAYATGVAQEKRRLYTDDEAVVVRPHSFIAISARNPASFRRDDVADRCVILRLERRSGFTGMRLLKRQILDDRPRLFGEYLWYLGRIISELRQMDEAGEEFGLHETHRMADYAALGRVVGRVLGWEQEAVDDLMTALQRERDAFINEEDPLIDLLGKWLSYRPRNGPSNIGRPVNVFQLHAELETLAQAGGLMWKDSPRTLAQKLRSDHIETELHVEMYTEGGHKIYRIRRRSDPRLEVV